MTIIITTPTGNIGSRLTDKLLDAGAEVTLLARDPAKVEEAAKRGAKVLKGDLSDRAFVVESTRGADALFWLTPPNMAAKDFGAYQRALGDNAVEAIKANGIGHVVHLSSIGAHLGKGCGPVNGLHDVEKGIDAVAKSVLHLRAAFFMENFLWQLESIQGAGSVFMALPGSLSIPMVATRDIADAAAARLLDRSWQGRNVLGLHGPKDVSFDEAAAILTHVLERPVKHVQVPPQAVRDAMTGMGVGASMVDGFLEMYEGLTTGHMKAEFPRSAQSTTTTTFEQFAREVLRPAVA